MDAKRFDRFAKAFGARLSRRTALSAGTALAGLTLTGPLSAPAAAQEATPSPAGAGPGWLLLQRFASATLSPAPDGAELILAGVEPKLLAFTDRPARLTRSVPAAVAWNWAADPDDPPNATLLAEPAEGGDEVSLVVELVATRYDEAASQMTATVRVLGEGNPEDIGTPTAATGERRFGSGHLFVDDLTFVQINCEPCDSAVAFYQFRFNQGCYQNYPDCAYCAGWAYCNGSFDSGVAACGTVESTCQYQ